MAQQTLNNGELGSSWRSKVNANFTELYTYSIRTNVSGQINAVTEKTSFADNDVFLIEDSAASYAKKRLKKSNLGIDSTRIEDTGQTTGLYTEETADTLVGHSANTGTDLIFEMFEGTGTPVSVFQLDGNGNIFNNGEYQLVKNPTSFNLMIGTGSTHSALTNATNNIFIGEQTGNDIRQGDNNISIGYLTGGNILDGSDNISIGDLAGWNITNQTKSISIGTRTSYTGSGASNTIIGYFSGTQNAGSFNVFLGANSGRYQTATSNKLLIDNQDRSTLAAELTDSLIVGDFHATPASQTIQFNASTTVRSAYTAGPIFRAFYAPGGTVFEVDYLGNVKSQGYEKSTGSIKDITTFTSGTTAITDQHHHCLLDATAGTVTLTLPAISTDVDGQIYAFLCIEQSNVCTLQVTGGDYIGYTGTTSSVLFIAGQQRVYQADSNSGRWMEYIV